MHNLSEKFKAELSSSVTTFALCYYIKRRDNKIVTFTTYGDDLVIDGLSYSSKGAFTSSALETSSSLSIDNMEIAGALDHELIKAEDIENGHYDYAYVEIFMVNYRDLTQGRLNLKSGYIGEVRLQSGQFVAELRGLTQRLSTNIGQLYSSQCRAIFADGNCGVNKEKFQHRAKITGVISTHCLMVDAMPFEVEYYAYGLLLFNSGNNKGQYCEIFEVRDKQVFLQLPPPQTPQIGDELTITAGCDKNFSTCCERYNNAINFRGEPHLPGIDEVLKTSGTFRN